MPGLAIGLAAAALVLFALASWRGRWALWVGGYIAAILALALALALAAPLPGAVRGDGSDAAGWNSGEAEGFSIVSMEGS